MGSLPLPWDVEHMVEGRWVGGWVGDFPYASFIDPFTYPPTHLQSIASALW